MVQITKRDGRKRKFNPEKIYEGIISSMKDIDQDMIDEKLAKQVTDWIVEQVSDQEVIRSEDIYDLLVRKLISLEAYELAATFIRYRDERTEAREVKSKLMKSIAQIAKETTKDNANVGNSPSAKMLQVGSESSKWYNLANMPKHIAKAHKQGVIHIHDLDYYEKTINCLQIDLGKLLARGFNNGHGFIRPPKRIGSAAALAAIILQSNQNDMYGGQSFDQFDTYMAPYVPKDYAEASKLKTPMYVNGSTDPKSFTRGRAHEIRNEVYQAMEGLVYNLNSMHCLPYSEKIWVYDTVENELHQMAIGELAEVFEPRRYMAISYDAKAGIAIFKYITAIQRKDNNRRLVTVVDNEGRRVTTTDNHKFVYLDNQGGLQEEISESLPHVLSPRGILFPGNITGRIDLSPYKSRTKQNYSKDYVEITSDFAVLAGYYVADGSIVSQSQLCFTVCDRDKEAELISLMQSCYGEGVTWKTYPRPDGQPKDIRFNVGKVWASAFRDNFGDSAETKHIPFEIIGTRSEEIRVGFLNGYFKCDGSIKTNYIIATTVSESLRNELSLLIMSLEELPHVGVRISTSNYGTSINYEVSISGLAENRMELGFDCKAAYEQKHYDYNFLIEKIVKSGKLLHHNKIKPQDIDIYASRDNSLQAVRGVFPVTINSLLEANSGDEYVYDMSVEDTENFLTAEGIFVHNSRAGAQVPFSSINFGCDTTYEGRLVTEMLLKAFEAGLGRGETPLFPNLVFRLKQGINMNPGDPNYDLFQLACKVASRRMNPTFSFMDMSINQKFGIQVSYMGCRSRVQANIHGPEQATSRGNIGFVTMNLVRCAIDSGGNWSKFYKNLDKLLALCEEQLLHRFEVICKLRVRDLPFLMGEKLYLGSEDLKPDDSIRKAAKHGTLSIGYIGIAEVMKIMEGKHHGEDEEVYKKALYLAEYIALKVKEMTERNKLNFTTLATPAEGLSGRFIALDKDKYGIIEGITDKGYYTNSYHIPVDYKISSFDKLRLEGLFHKFCDAGHISYVELGEAPIHNPEAVETLVKFAGQCDMGYMGINFPIDHCTECGHQGIIDDECPACGSQLIKRIRRITGYLSSTDRFGDGKRAELSARIVHGEH